MSHRMSHRIESGILVDGIVQPRTDWILRDSRAWFENGVRGTVPRTRDVNLIIGHWTAGRCHEGPEAARKVVMAMRNRTRPDGTPMDIGVHFVVSWDGLVTQVADLAHKTIHVGKKRYNDTSIGVECCWPGTYAQARKLGIEGHMLTRKVRGKTLQVLRPSDALLAGWNRLCSTLLLIRHPHFDITKVIEHCDVPGTTKVDAAGLLREAAYGNTTMGQVLTALAA